MRYEEALTVLKLVGDFHKRTADLYREQAAKSNRARNRILLDYLADRQEELREAVGGFVRSADEEVLATWTEFNRDPKALWKRLAEQLGPDADSEDILTEAMHVTEVLIKEFQRVARTAETPELQQVFENLAQREERERLKLARNANLLQDF